MRTRHRIERTVAAMARRIVRRFAPEKVILFGSHATGAAGADSDVDVDQRGPEMPRSMCNPACVW